MMGDHSLIEELLAADALGGLDDDDKARLARERSAHGACEECRSIEIGFAETAGRIAFSLTPQPVDDSMIERILSQPGAHRARQEPIAAVAGPPADELSERRAGRSRAWMGLTAAAAAIALTVVVIGSLGRGGTVAAQASTSQRFVEFAGSHTDARLAMAFTPGTPGAVLWGSGLDDPGAGQVYELWMIDDGEAISAGCVSPTDGVVAFRVDARIDTSQSMAVTNESSACPSEPTSPPILSADLPTLL